MFQTVLQRLIDRQDLAADEMEAVMSAMMSGQASPAQIAGLLVALRMKGETVTEIAAAARVMRRMAEPVSAAGEHLVDACGTGGDGRGLFNVSTGAAFVAAAGGAAVAKHGNRAASGHSGSADVLEAMQARIDLSPEQVARGIRELGLGFMFAPLHHGAMKHAVGPRRELGVRTLFNLLGPLCNPAAVRRQLLGVFDSHWLQPLAEVLRSLGSIRVLVVHSQDGLDEISAAAATDVAELDDGEIRRYRICPADFGMAEMDLATLVAADPQQSASLLQAGLRGEDRAARQMLALNGGAVLYAAGVVSGLVPGVKMAEDLIDSGQALEKLKQFIAFTQAAAEPSQE